MSLVNEPSSSDNDEEYFWNRTTQIAMQTWKNDSLLKSLYHETGFIMAAVSSDAYEHCRHYAENENTHLTPLDTTEEFRKTMPKGVLKGDFSGWRGFWKKSGAGWVFACGAIKAMHDEAVRLGVRFVTGEAVGKVESLQFSNDHCVITGAKTVDGMIHLSTQTILAAGASSDLLLDFKNQLRPTAWTLAHLPLSSDEAALYRDLPVLYGVDRGFFIEPDAQRHDMKVCDEHPGYINPLSDSDGNVHSVPFARHAIPKESEDRMRKLLAETMPQFAERKFSFARLCWDADTVDRIFLIDEHPSLQGLIIAVGGSGNGFMACPAVGIMVADIVEGKSDERLRRATRWRPELARGRDLWASQGRYGADGKVMELREVKEWTEGV